MHKDSGIVNGNSESPGVASGSLQQSVISTQENLCPRDFSGREVQRVKKRKAKAPKHRAPFLQPGQRDFNGRYALDKGEYFSPPICVRRAIDFFYDCGAGHDP